MMQILRTRFFSDQNISGSDASSYRYIRFRPVSGNVRHYSIRAFNLIIRDVNSDMIRLDYFKVLQMAIPDFIQLELRVEEIVKIRKEAMLEAERQERAARRQLHNVGSKHKRNY